MGATLSSVAAGDRALTTSARRCAARVDAVGVIEMNTLRMVNARRLFAAGVLAALAAACGGGHASSNEPGTIALAALTVTPASVPLGVTATGRVTLTNAASTATVVSLSASSNAVSIPSSVTIGTGSSAVDFSITTVSV